ncbi:hypothetical protein M2J86_24450 (plasmid) [Citrobacter freundii]|nr:MULTISPECIES: hypothetical protein [Citrobacter]EET7319288.1 hypothetical protein [Escherichia coli]EJY4260644.1 hypothetical protein [Escherichia coli]ELD7993917.1 hypothetical protein [Citrobacter freundii]ELE2066146.1 hypothetical protein [Citrobacter freundii]ELQ7923042.1 hypothetical protein [Citrobacter freundii]
MYRLRHTGLREFNRLFSVTFSQPVYSAIMTIKKGEEDALEEKGWA